MVLVVFSWLEPFKTLFDIYKQKTIVVRLVFKGMALRDEDF